MQHLSGQGENFILMAPGSTSTTLVPRGPEILINLLGLELFKLILATVLPFTEICAVKGVFSR